MGLGRSSPPGFIFPMRGEFVDLKGERIYYYAAGSRGAGDPVVLIHGFATSSHVWVDVVPKLPAGHRVVVVDLLGFGRSDAPPEADYSVAGHGARLLHLLDALHVERACLVGHDHGGAIASWVALNGRDRVTRLGIIGDALVESGRALASKVRRCILRLPQWIWVPLMRRAIARRYADPDRGNRSAVIFLMPFVVEGGTDILRRHLDSLDDGQASAVQSRAAELTIPRMSFGAGQRRSAPEEAPSDVAAAIADLLAR